MTKEHQQKYFDQFVSKMRDTVLKKGDDYAGQEDRLSNFKMAGQIAGNSAEVNCFNLIGTKIARLNQLLNSGVKANFESVDDTLLDLANYTFLLACIRKESSEQNLPF